MANATSFTLTITGGNDKLISLSQGFGMFFETDKLNGDILSDWTATENAASTAITFTAPNAADDLVAGQRFDVDVTFKNPLPNNFAYAITWGGAAVPEPATWAMMIAGLGLIGGVLRRKNAMAWPRPDPRIRHGISGRNPGPSSAAGHEPAVAEALVGLAVEQAGEPSGWVTLPPAATSTAWAAAMSHSMVGPCG